MAVCLCTVGVCLFAILDSPQLSKACCHCAYNCTWIEPLNFALYLQSLRGVRQAFTALDWSGPALPSGKHCGACASRTQVVEHRVYIKWPQEDLGSLKKKPQKNKCFSLRLMFILKKKKPLLRKSWHQLFTGFSQKSSVVVLTLAYCLHLSDVMCGYTQSGSVTAHAAVFAQSRGWKRQHLSSDFRKLKPQLCLHQSDCGWRAADGVISFWKFHLPFS